MPEVRSNTKLALCAGGARCTRVLCAVRCERFKLKLSTHHMVRQCLSLALLLPPSLPLSCRQSRELADSRLRFAGFDAVHDGRPGV